MTGRPRRRRQRTDAIDRLASRYQGARLHARAMRERLTAALAVADPRAIREAHARLRSAAAWESRTQRRYVRAVLLAYAWLDHPGRAAPAA